MEAYFYDHDLGAARWAEDAEYREKTQDYYRSVTGYEAGDILADGEYWRDGTLLYTLEASRTHPDLYAEMEGRDRLLRGLQVWAFGAPEPPWVTWGCYETPHDTG